jgi:chromosome segregation ATPase
MTLTEEQRGTVAFDPEKARASIAHYRIENPSNVDTESALKELVDQANLAEDALAEIERLRAETEEAQESLTAAYLLGSHKKAQEMAARIKSLKKEIRRLKHESKVEQEFTNSYIKRLHDAEARIKELGSSLDEAEALTKKNAELMNGYLARIAELEDALVEERSGAIRCEFYDHCEIDLPDAMIRARQELQADGKIGPGARPPCWQITEERKETLRRALEEYKIFPNDQAVLRAMLREAE